MQFDPNDFSKWKYPPFQWLADLRGHTGKVTFAASNVDIAQPRRLERLRKLLRKSIDKFPDVCEGVITFGGVEHFFICAVQGNVAKVCVVPRDVAEVILNDKGLSTHEPWSPLPGSDVKH
jgi:hypothetical protein